MLNNGKAKIDNTFNGLNISIPSKKNWFALLFGTAWLGGWYFGLKNVSAMLFAASGHFAADGFMVFWLLLWTLGGVTIITILLWGYFGKEKFILTNDEVLFERSVFGLGRKRRLQAAEIKNARTEVAAGNWFGGNGWAFWGLGPGKIKFDYGLKTFSFGLALDDAEANYIVGLIMEHTNKYGQTQQFTSYKSIN